MFSPFLRPQAQSQPTISPAAEFLEAADLTLDLPDRLILDANGQPFEPIQLVATEETRTLPEQLTLLMRPEPTGGAEALIQSNRTRILDQARSKLYQRLAAGAQSSTTRTFLAELQAASRSLKEGLQVRQDDIQATYSRVHDQLRQWQDYASHGAGGWVQGLVRWIFGGGGQMSLPQAVAVWNEREHLYLVKLSTQSAMTASAQFLESVTFLLEHLDGLLHQARSLQAQTRQQLQDLARPTPIYAPWSWRFDPPTIATALAQQISTEALLAQLLDGLWDDTGDSRLATEVRQLAQREAERRLAALSVMGVIETEASQRPLPGVDPVVLVGQTLLQALTERPSWQLVPHAHPRVETLQVTPDGSPLFSLEHLGTAAYGGRSDRLAFVQVQQEVAVDELKLIRDSDERFDKVLQERNLFVLEDLAARAEASLMPPALTATNGHGDTAASLSHSTPLIISDDVVTGDGRL